MQRLFICVLIPLITIRTFADDGDYFENHIRPLFVEHCYSCHSDKKEKGGLKLDSVASIKKGIDGEPVVVPGELSKSKLWLVLNYEHEIKMPPKRKLEADQLQHVQRWILSGAALPKQVESTADTWKTHWAFQPLQVENRLPLATAIDELVKRRLPANFSLSQKADRRTLLRRAKYDLLGLPPTYQEMVEFVEAPGTDQEAFAKLVDSYLSNPHSGERWARHWLDLARYADNKGYIGVGVDRTYPFAWTYRDWVVNAFNRDMPYDEFLRLQLAADQLVRKDNKADLAAMGFLTVGRRFIGNIHDIIDDRIDVTMRTMMGLTVQCARCHDHKYDPIGIKDYYSLYGVFQNSKEPELENMPLLGMERDKENSEAFEKELNKLKAELAKWEADHETDRKEKPRQFFEQRKPFENKIKQLHNRHPGAPPRAMVLIDNNKITEPVVFQRGNPANRGAKVERQFLPFLRGEIHAPFTVGSGRLELAKAISHENNPLTARVWVNRIWEHLLGKPLVPTPSDFGLRSEPPAQPALLDKLAYELIQSGWSTKTIIREIMLSHIYQQTSENQFAWKNDPENKFLARMNRKRLEWEPMRDSLLAVSGELDTQIGGPSVDIQGKTRRRSLYAFIDRQNLPGTFRTFDVAIPDTHSPMRFTTNVPQQALYFMNSVLVTELSKKLASKLEQESITDPTDRIHRLYQCVLARNASPDELELAQRYLKNNSSAWPQLAQALLMTNEFLFVD
ncbi:MAG TPA: PSD1 and planctomycete cytochrome C domain-containing protein [Gemmatales bacterium]|nr:PSD1 and planctomycete cytochrome C domain-containing protein [Gemmatales bacterium]